MRLVHVGASTAAVQDLFAKRILAEPTAGVPPLGAIRCLACGEHGHTSSVGQNDVWVGQGFMAQRILVLGESWYGASEPLVSYLPRWIIGDIRDGLFSRLHRLSGYATTKPRSSGRTEFWNGIAFTNFLPTALPTRKDRPKTEGFAAGRLRLRQLLQELRPRAVLILGKEQGRVSEPIVSGEDIVSVVVEHPAAYGVRNATLQVGYLAVGLTISAPST